MKTINLNDGTSITTVKECGEAFFTWHKKQAEADKNLKLIKGAIEENKAIAWFKHGISVERDRVNKQFNKGEAEGVIRDLCKKLGYSENKTKKMLAKCIKATDPFTKISKAK
jgi:hypothetical protein